MAESEDGMQKLDNMVSNIATQEEEKEIQPFSGSEDDMQKLDNMVSNTTTQEEEKDIQPFSGIFDVEELREMMESDPFIRQAIDSLSEYLDSRNVNAQDEDEDEDHDLNCANQGPTLSDA